VLGGQTSTLLGPEAFGEARSIEALASLLNAIGSKERPVMIVLDDFQWVDELMIKLMTQWRDAGNTPFLHPAEIVG
jgi:predicted ATPase